MLNALLAIISLFALLPAEAVEHRFSPYTAHMQLPYATQQSAQGATLYFAYKPVHKGDVIVLETGERIIFDHYIAQGGHSILIKDAAGDVIRMPILNTEASLEMNLSFLGSQMILSQALSKQHIVQSLYPNFKSLYAVKVENLDLKILAGDFLKTPRAFDSPMMIELADFLKDYSAVEFNSDFHPWQLGYVPNRGWVLFDFGAEVRMVPDGQKLPLRLSVRPWARWLNADVYRKLVSYLDDYERNSMRRSRGLSCRQILH